MLKQCSECGEEKQYPAQFKRGGEKPSGGYYYRAFCIECDRKKQSAYRLKKGLTKTPRGTPVDDLKDKKIGDLLILSHIGWKKSGGYNKSVWLCECVCGHTIEVWESNLKNGHTNSCGCMRHKQGKESKAYRGYGEISLKKFNSIKNGAAARNIEFDITIEYIWELFVKQNKQCKITKQTISLNSSNKVGDTASLDRIDSAKGYTEDNVQWVHKDINMMKRTYDQDYFIRLCKLVAGNN